MKKLIYFLLTLSACGPNPESSKFVEEEIKEHVELFSKLNNNKTNIEIKYSKLPDNVIGLCYIYTDGSSNIEIDEKAYKSYSYSGKQELIFHELGHCILNRSHLETRYTWEGVSIPTSIMYPFAFGEFWYYNENITHYHDELIKGK